MPDWGEIFANPEMQRRQPNPEFLALLPLMKQAGCRKVLDAGCGVGRQLLPLVQEGFTVWGVDREAQVLELLKTRLTAAAPAWGRVLIARADLKSLPFASEIFDLVLSINVINHGDTRTFQAYCRELNRVLRSGGHLFINVSPLEFGELMLLPQTQKLEPGTYVDIATPDGTLVHHFPTPEELRVQFPRHRVHRWETVRAPIPFMGDVELPQLIFWGEKRS